MSKKASKRLGKPSTASSPLLQRVATEAEGLAIGTNLILLPLHNAVGIAEIGAFMDLITGGKFLLGVDCKLAGPRFESLCANQITGKMKNQSLSGTVGSPASELRAVYVQCTPKSAVNEFAGSLATNRVGISLDLYLQVEAAAQVDALPLDSQQNASPFCDHLRCRVCARRIRNLPTGADNGLVAGSSPPGPTTHSDANRGLTNSPRFRG